MPNITAEQIILAYPIAYLAVTGIPLIVIDIRERRLPNKITLPFIAMALLANLTASIVTANLAGFFFSVLVALLFGVAGTIFSYRGWIGMGDVKLSVGMLLVVGYFSLWLPLALVGIVTGATLIGIVVQVILRHTGRSYKQTIAVGPYLVVSFLTLAIPALLVAA